MDKDFLPLLRLPLLLLLLLLVLVLVRIVFCMEVGVFSFEEEERVEEEEEAEEQLIDFFFCFFSSSSLIEYATRSATAESVDAMSRPQLSLGLLCSLVVLPLDLLKVVKARFKRSVFSIPPNSGIVSVLVPQLYVTPTLTQLQSIGISIAIGKGSWMYNIIVFLT